MPCCGRTWCPPRAGVPARRCPWSSPPPMWWPSRERRGHRLTGNPKVAVVQGLSDQIQGLKDKDDKDEIMSLLFLFCTCVFGFCWWYFQKMRGFLFGLVKRNIWQSCECDKQAVCRPLVASLIYTFHFCALVFNGQASSNCWFRHAVDKNSFLLDSFGFRGFGCVRFFSWQGALCNQENLDGA